MTLLFNANYARSLQIMTFECADCLAGNTHVYVMEKDDLLDRGTFCIPTSARRLVVCQKHVCQMYLSLNKYTKLISHKCQVFESECALFKPQSGS